MKKRIGIIGGGRFGQTLATGLADQGVEVILMDINRETIELIASTVAKAVIGDATRQGILEQAGISECDTAVVTISENMEASILVTMALKELKVPYVVARALSETHGKVLLKVGADKVVYPARDIALRLARTLAVSSVHDYVEVAEGISVLEIEVPERWYGKNLVDTAIRSSFGVMVLAINRNRKENDGSKTVIAPSGDDVIFPGDRLLVFGTDAKLKAFEEGTMKK